MSRLIKSSQKEADKWEGDKFERKELAEKLTPLLSTIREPFVISLDAQYGGGKSYFLKNWQSDLEQQGYLCVSFNAWETDFSDDPLTAFISAIDRQLNTKLEKDDPSDKVAQNLKRAADVIKGMGVNTLLRVLPVLMTGFLRQQLGEDGVKEINDIFNDDVEEGLINLSAKSATEIIEKKLAIQKQQEDAISAFSKELKNIIEEITANFEDDKKKLIIFVDELDRCRPTYAVEILEKIKHFFAVDGIVFILGVDEKQLANAMTGVYGPRLDTDGYLRKFIDWRLQLPSPSNAKYIEYLFEKFELNTEGMPFSQGWLNNKEALKDGFSFISEVFQLSLRQQEQYFTELHLILGSQPQKEFSFSLALSMLLVLSRSNEVGELVQKAAAIQHYVPPEIGYTLAENIESAREIFKAIWEKAHVNNAFAKNNRLFERWSDKATFEGEFLSWFVNLGGSDVLERLSKGNGNPGYDYDLDVFGKCLTHVNRYSITRNQSIAHIIMQRINFANMLLKS